jgi:hypothetical protein
MPARGALRRRKQNRPCKRSPPIPAATHSDEGQRFLVAKVGFRPPIARQKLSDNCRKAMQRQNAGAVQTNCRRLLQFTGGNDAISEGIKINVTI